MASQCPTCDREIQHAMNMRQCLVCVATEVQVTQFGIKRAVARKTVRQRVDEEQSLAEELT